MLQIFYEPIVLGLLVLSAIGIMCLMGMYVDAQIAKGNNSKWIRIFRDL